MEGVLAPILYRAWASVLLGSDSYTVNSLFFFFLLASVGIVLLEAGLLQRVYDKGFSAGMGLQKALVAAKRKRENISSKKEHLVKERTSRQRKNISSKKEATELGNSPSINHD
jgi:endonuclease YncB( thermonuclease family)